MEWHNFIITITDRWSDTFCFQILIQKSKPQNSMRRMLHLIFNSIYVAPDKYWEIHLLEWTTIERFCQVMPFTLLINIQSSSVGSLSMVSLLGKSHWFKQRTPLTFLNENSIVLKIIGGRTISTHNTVLCNYHIEKKLFFFYVRNTEDFSVSYF